MKERDAGPGKLDTDLVLASQRGVRLFEFEISKLAFCLFVCCCSDFFSSVDGLST